MNIIDFQSQPTGELAKIVEANQIQVCGFTFNGTRRWFRLEHPKQQQDTKAYILALSKRVIEISAMLFDHGVSTLVLPVISPHVLQKRDAAYQYMATEALKLLVSHPLFLRFYEEYGVGVHIYGDYQAYLAEETAVYLAQKQAALKQGQNGRCRRIFFGICAHDATDAISQLTINHFQIYGSAPTKTDLIKAYYGDDIQPLDLYIGASKPQTIDMPLLSSGRESLYFTVAPSPYFNQAQLRDILYDHIYQRQEVKDHAPVSETKELTLRQFYLSNQRQTLGVGHRNSHWDVWHPMPQVVLPARTAVSPSLPPAKTKTQHPLRQLWQRLHNSHLLTLDNKLIPTE